MAVERALDITARYKTFNHTGDSEDFVIGQYAKYIMQGLKSNRQTLTNKPQNYNLFQLFN